MRNKANSKFISVCTYFCQMARISKFGELSMCFYQKLLKNVTSASQIVKIWCFMWKATFLVTLAFGKNLLGISSWEGLYIKRNSKSLFFWPDSIFFRDLYIANTWLYSKIYLISKNKVHTIAKYPEISSLFQ